MNVRVWWLWLALLLVACDSTPTPPAYAPTWHPSATAPAPTLSGPGAQQTVDQATVVAVMERARAEQAAATAGAVIASATAEHRATQAAVSQAETQTAGSFATGTAYALEVQQATAQAHGATATWQAGQLGYAQTAQAATVEAVWWEATRQALAYTVELEAVEHQQQLESAEQQHWLDKASRGGWAVFWGCLGALTLYVIYARIWAYMQHKKVVTTPEGTHILEGKHWKLLPAVVPLLSAPEDEEDQDDDPEPDTQPARGQTMTINGRPQVVWPPGRDPKAMRRRRAALLLLGKARRLHGEGHSQIPSATVMGWSGAKWQYAVNCIRPYLREAVNTSDGTWLDGWTLLGLYEAVRDFKALTVAPAPVERRKPASRAPRMAQNVHAGV